MAEPPKLVKNFTEPEFNRAEGTAKAPGRPFPTIDNLGRLLDSYGITYRYNVISKEILLEIPGQNFTVDNAYNASLAWITSRMEEYQMPTRHHESHLLALCDRNIVNPVKDYIIHKAWDGISRKKDFFNTIKAKDEHMKEVFLNRFMVGAIHAVFSPDGVAGAICPVLHGEQGLGKGRWIKKLVPVDEYPGFIKPEGSLTVHSKDSEEQTICYWIVELAELEGIFRRSDIASIKSFLMRAFDVLRKSYGKRAGTFPRRTVFIATVNQRLFLRDQTGNRRFLPITCLEINYNHTLDMQQVWAEFYEDWKAGEQYWLTDAEYAELKKMNKDYEAIDLVYEAILQSYNWEEPNVHEWGWRTATQVLQEINWKDMSKGAASDATDAVLDLNENKYQRKSKARLLLVPPLKSGVKTSTKSNYTDMY